MRPLVVIPAFNESGAIGRVIEGIRAADPRVPILVVDDGSADDTADRARHAGAHVVRLPFNSGVRLRASDGLQVCPERGL